MMDENNSNIQKKVLICIHGFLTGDYHDFDFFKSYVQDKYPGEIELLYLYQYGDKTTYDSHNWGKVAEKVTQEYMDKGYEVNLIGYSMGASVAAYVAAKIKVNKVVFIAPYIKLLGTKMLSHHIKLLIKLIKLKIKYRHNQSLMNKIKKRSISFALVVQVLLSVRRYRKFYRKVRVDALIIMGLQDRDVPLSAASKAYRLIKSKKKQLWLLDHLDHVFIFDKELSRDVFDRILMFVEQV